jgi:hypothetical protein
LDGHLSLVGHLVSSQWLRAGGWERLRVRIAAAASSTTLPLWLVRASEVKFGQVDYPSISSHVFGETIRMCLQLMGLEIHLGIEDHKFLFQAFLVQAEEMVF